MGKLFPRDPLLLLRRRMGVVVVDVAVLVASLLLPLSDFRFVVVESSQLLSPSCCHCR